MKNAKTLKRVSFALSVASLIIGIASNIVDDKVQSVELEQKVKEIVKPMNQI